MDKRDWGTLNAIAKEQGTTLPGGGVAVAKKQRKCGKCGEIGHNARTCGEDDKPLVQRPAVVAATDAPSPLPEKIKQVEHPAPQYSAAERKHRTQEGKELVEAHRLIIYARIERWLLDKHQIIARRVPGVDDLKNGAQMVFVETKPTSWGGREPTKHYRGKIKKFDKKAGRIFFKYQRDTASYNTDIDMVLNLKVPGRSRYFLLFDGKSAK